MTRVPKSAIQAEIQRADQMLQSLEGESVETLTVNSLDAQDAPFLGLVVSKLSPMIGNLLERRVTKLLAEEGPGDHGLQWVRQDPGFPDALLVDSRGDSLDAGYEVKAWYALSTELTGRFRESVNLLAPREIRVVIVAWMMSHVVYGTPHILGVLTTPAVSIAERRDLHYMNPPNYITVEPRDTTQRTRNLQQTNVNGYRLQETSAKKVSEAMALVRRHPGAKAMAHTPEAQKLVAELIGKYAYRLDTNFAKVDRIDHPDIEAFKAKVLARVERGRSLKAWTQLLKDLNDEKNPARQEQAAAIIQKIYDAL